MSIQARTPRRRLHATPRVAGFDCGHGRSTSFLRGAEQDVACRDEQFENAKILGLSALRRRAVAERTAFPYDAPVDGLRVLERYRFEVRLSEPAPRLIHVFAAPAIAGAVGLRSEFEVGTFGQLIKRSLAGDLMMWGFSWSAGAPDCDFFLGLAYGPNSDQSNDSRFSLPAFDRLYERQRVLPDGPERLALVREATRLMLAYMPYLPRHHRVNTDLLHTNVRGHLRHPFRRDVWCCVDLEPAP